MGPITIPAVALNRKFLSDQADVSLELSAPGSAALMAALRSSAAPIPPGELILGNIKASAGGATKVALGPPGGKVSFSGHADAAFSIGVYIDGADALKAVAPSDDLVEGLVLADPEATRYMVVRAAYNMAGIAKGAMALGAGTRVKFGVSGASQGLFALIHRFEDSQPAAAVFRDTFSSWALPKQVTEADDLAPGTWLLAEVDGSIAIQLGVQAGYDLSWVREIPGGALAGDIGLRVELGARGAFGFDASGRYAVVLGRENSDPVLRLRLFKMARKGWNFTLDVRSGLTTELPPFFEKTHKAEDLVAAIFGLNESQLIDALRDARVFVNKRGALNDKLAGVLLDLEGVTFENALGMQEEQLRQVFESGRKQVITFLKSFDDLQSSGGHDLTSMLLSLPVSEFEQFRAILQDIAATGGETQVQQLVRGLLSRAGFELTPIARLIEAGVGPALGILTDTQPARQLQELAAQVLELIDAGTLKNLLTFIRSRVTLDRITNVATQSDFDGLDNLLKSRLAAFLGRQEVLMSDLRKIQDAVRAVFANVDKFYSMALRAADRVYGASISARYAASTMRTALLDVSFDLSAGGTAELMRQAVDGNFGTLLLEPVDGVTVNTAELTHNIRRNVSTELTLPFGTISRSAETLSSANLTVIEDAGRVLVYGVDAESEAKQRRKLFGAHITRDSTLTIAATMPLAVGSGVRKWKDASFSYSYRMECAVEKMRQSQFLHEVGHLVRTYVPESFAPPAATFEEWTGDLDKLLDGLDPNSGTHDIGDTLITLTLSAPPAWLKAWTNAPAERKNTVYMDLSKALQARLKELVTFYWFADASRYSDLASAAAPIVYSCLPPSTSIRTDGDRLAELDTKRDIYWDNADMNQIRAMANCREAQSNLRERLRAIEATLRGIPLLAGKAAFYAQDQMDEVVAAALRRFSPGSQVPELLGSLLFLESRLIDNAVRVGTEIGRFRRAALTRPSEALEHLAKFGLDLADTFNRTFGDHPFMNGASRPLATLLFMESARQFDPALADIRPAALLDIKIVKSGQIGIDDMLSAEVPAEIILHEQKFLEA